jgi:hypothetical protein
MCSGEIAKDLRERDKVVITECFIHGTFANTKKGVCLGKTKKCKATKFMAIADASGLSHSVRTTASSIHEVNLVEQYIEKRFIRQLPKRLIGNLVYASDLLDHRSRGGW